MQMLFASTIFLLMTLASVSCLHCYTIANDVCSLSIWCANKESGFCSQEKTRLKGVRVLKPCVYRGLRCTPQGVRVLKGAAKKPYSLSPDPHSSTSEATSSITRPKSPTRSLSQVGRGAQKRWLGGKFSRGFVVKALV